MREENAIENAVWVHVIVAMLEKWNKTKIDEQ